MGRAHGSRSFGGFANDPFEVEKHVSDVDGRGRPGGCTWEACVRVIRSLWCAFPSIERTAPGMSVVPMHLRLARLFSLEKC